jgi:hypothetical protein
MHSSWGVLLGKENVQASRVHRYRTVLVVLLTMEQPPRIGMQRQNLKLLTVNHHLTFGWLGACGTHPKTSFKPKFKTQSNQKCNRNQNQRVNYINPMVWQYKSFVNYGLPHEWDLESGCLSGHLTWFQQGHRTRPYSRSTRGISAACPTWKLAASALTCNSQFTTSL